MRELLFVAPLAAVVVLLASGRAGGVVAGFVALALAVPAAYVALDGRLALVPFLADATLRGGWLAWQAIAVMLAGMFFHRATSRDPHDAAAGRAGADGYRTLFRSCCLVGVFLESLTGFGVGYLMAFAATRRLGIAGVPGLILPLFSQMLVAWGALAVGTGIGANLAGIPVRTLSLWSLVVAACVVLGYLALFWRLAARGGVAPSRGDRLLDVVSMLALLGFIAFFSHLDRVEIAGLAASGAVVALDALLGLRRDGVVALRARVAAAWPIVLVTVLLLATRLVPELRDAVRAAGLAQPYADGPSFGWFYNPSVYLVLGALVAIAARGELDRLPAIVGQTARAAWRPVAVTLIYVVLSMWLVRAGIAAALAGAAVAALGVGALFASPLVGALGGFLTGSNTGSNALAMPIQAGMAAQSALPSGLLPGVQNVVGSNFTMLAPQRIAMARALGENRIDERTIYRAVAPLGAVSFAVGVIVIGVALLFAH